MSHQILQESAVLNQHPNWWARPCSNHCILVFRCLHHHLVNNMWLFLYQWLFLYHITNSNNNNNNRHQHPQVPMWLKVQSLVLLCPSILQQQHLCQTCIMECQISPRHHIHHLVFPIHNNNLLPKKRITAVHNGDHLSFSLLHIATNFFVHTKYAMFHFIFLNWSTRLQNCILLQSPSFSLGVIGSEDGLHWECYLCEWRGSFDRQPKKSPLQ